MLPEQRREAEAMTVDERVANRVRERAEVIDADARELAVAAQRPVQVLLQPHHRPQQFFVERKVADDRALDVGPAAGSDFGVDVDYPAFAFALAERTGFSDLVGGQSDVD